MFSWYNRVHFFDAQRFHFYISQAPTPLNLHQSTTTKFPLHARGII
jgi:hypothetical protein